MLFASPPPLFGVQVDLIFAAAFLVRARFETVDLGHDIGNHFHDSLK